MHILYYAIGLEEPPDLEWKSMTYGSTQGSSHLKNLTTLLE